MMKCQPPQAAAALPSFSLLRLSKFVRKQGGHARSETPSPSNSSMPNVRQSLKYSIRRQSLSIKKLRSFSKGKSYSLPSMKLTSTNNACKKPISRASASESQWRNRCGMLSNACSNNNHNNKVISLHRVRVVEVVRAVEAV